MPNPIGTITLWSGALVDIPLGWALCDGTNGTPDLTDRFIVGAGSGWGPGETGGAETHTHTQGSQESVLQGVGPQVWVAGVSGSALNAPLFYALAHIMRLS